MTGMRTTPTEAPKPRKHHYALKLESSRSPQFAADKSHTVYTLIGTEEPLLHTCWTWGMG